MRPHRLASSVVVGFALLAAFTAPLCAQGKLAGYTESGFGPVFERWQFGGGADGIRQPSADGSSSVQVKSVTQWSLPFSIAVPIGSRWTADLTGAYATGTVKLAAADPLTNSDEYSVSGLTDLRLRATGRLVGDNVLLTAGVNVPTGKTELDGEELSAVRVLAAPALSFQVPVLGIGASGTLGLVFAREIAGLAWALGTSYEVRNKYTPVSIAAGLPVELSPSDAFRVSLGTDALIGQNSMTIALSADFFSRDHLDASVPGGGGAVRATSQLGPIYTADWMFRATTSRFRELTFYAVDRYRSAYKRDGKTTTGSDANYLDAGVRGVAVAGRSTGILMMLNGRHHTGLDSDESLATAAIVSGALTLGLVQELTGNYSFLPFVRAQVGRIESGDVSSTATGLSAGASLRVRF